LYQLKQPLPSSHVSFDTIIKAFFVAKTHRIVLFCRVLCGLMLILAKLWGKM